MANENNDISDIVKKCKILLLDIEGTTTSISFVKDKLFPYAEENVKDFLTNQWEIEDVKKSVAALRKLSLEDKENNVDGVVTIPGEDASKEDQIEGLVNNVKWQMSSDRKVGPLKQLQGLIWKQGYDKGDIKGHVYDDVSPALELWRSVEGQKVYIYSSGSVLAQKLHFGQSSAGDLLKFIDGHFDTGVGPKKEAASYTAIAEKVDCKPEEILFLTDIVKEAEAAREAGINAALVSREGNAPLPSEATAFPVLYTLAQLANTNKRKPDTQVEQPAKVLKTDVDADVKTASETEPTSEVEAPSTKETPKAEATTETNGTSVADAAPEIIPNKPIEEVDKMEVEEEVPKEETPAQQTTPKATEKVDTGTVIEEVTDSNEIADTPVCDIEPVIEESSDKTENPETEKMETESSEIVTQPKENDELKNGEKDISVPEEIPSTTTVITEIKDVTNDKEALGEVAEIIDDLKPVVEEPPAVEDIEDLQSVGEVLQKECDEILSKVNDVTNIDNIPVKPLLNTIAEETMETDNPDTSDIVERILDSEMELEMKQNAEKELKAAEKISETVTEDKNEKMEATDNESTKVIPEEIPAATKSAEEIKETENKIEVNNPKEMQVEESKESTVENKTNAEEDKVENKMETNDNNTTETDDGKIQADKPKTEEIKPAEKLDTEENKDETDKLKSESNVETDKLKAENKEEVPAEQSTGETETLVDTKEKEKLSDEAKSESEPKEAQVNGKATNGDAKIVNQNGDISKKDELSSRLSVENGKEVVNGANGDSEKGEAKSESSTEVEVADLKVKTVAVDEPRNDPIEQPTEA